MAGRVALEIVIAAAVLLQAVAALNSSLLTLTKERDEQRRLCIEQVRDEYRRVIGPHVKGKHAHLVDMVWHGNFGDCVIEYGELLFMEEMGTPLKHYCSMKRCNFQGIERDLTTHPNDSVILLHGGGNFGDIYRHISMYHLDLVRRFENVPMIFLPQSVHYYFKRNAVRDAEVFAKHPSLRLLARDLPSLNFLKTYFKTVPVELAPDAAFMIGPVDVTCQPKVDIFFLKRKDTEQRKDLGDFEAELLELEKRGVTYKVDDWPCGMKRKRRLGNDKGHAKNGFLNGRDCLGEGGRVIISDRLHASILSTLMGLPYVYLDNSYKKVSLYREAIFATRPACTDENLRARKATSWKEAVEHGLALLREL